MAAMKVTTSAAMRARDVSRPHAEHLAFAETAQAGAASSRPAVPPVPAPMDAPARVDAPGPVDAPSAMGGTRRRWRPRGSGRGRASSR